MQIPPRDQRRLLFRLVAVLIAMRAVSVFSVDLDATEVAAVHALGVAGRGAPVLSRIVAAWFGAAGHLAGALRLPSIAADLALLLLTLAYARRQGWGTLTGLLAGFVLAMGPLGLDEGWRADGTPLLSVLALGALLLARSGLKLGRLGPALGSAVLVALATLVSPVTVALLPAGLYAALRSVTGAGLRYAVAGGWLAAAGVGLGLRVALLGHAGPLATEALAWLADPTRNGTGTGLPDGPVAALVGALATVSPGGPTGALAGLLQTLAAPAWRLWLGGALWLFAFLGLLRGQVMADPIVPAGGAASGLSGAGARDGWRSLGVSAPTAPRLIGERDWMPLLLGVLGPAAAVAAATARGNPAGIPEAIAIARPFAALLLGLGLTALAGMNRARSVDPRRTRRRFVGAMVTFTLLLLAPGGHHVLTTTEAPDRIAPTKIAALLRSELGSEPVVGVGPAGMAVTWRLDPYRARDDVVSVSSHPAALRAALSGVLGARPAMIGLCGDRGALQPELPEASRPLGGDAGRLADRVLGAAGYELMEDGVRFLGGFSVRLYARGGRDSSGSIRVSPQLRPGVAP